MSSKEDVPETAPADPNQASEAARYENPIASRELIRQVLAEARQPMSLNRLAEALQFPEEAEDQREALRRRVNAMLRDGQLVENRRGGLVPVDDHSLVAGRVSAHPDGFGFLIADDGDTDVFLHARQMRQLMHGDRVVVSIIGEDQRGRREGRLIEVVERANHSLVGRFQAERGVLFVVPDNKRIHHDLMIPVSEQNGAQHGDIVVAEITEQPGRRHPPVGRIAEVLGQHLEAGMEIDVALRNHDIPFEWPDAVLTEAATYSTEVQADDVLGRKDVRRIPLLTIDGADARDFDDAVYCERTDNGWKLLVAIADVAHYVRPGSALDEESRKRGTSVYFPGRVVPMLPEVLSNGLCSLNPDVDRLCMLCEMHVDERGQIKRSRFYNAVMRSHARLTYEKVWEMLSTPDSALREQYQDLLPHLEQLHELFKVLLAARHRRGVIEFSSTETRIVFDENRKIEDIVPVVRNDAHRLIEECMILANVAAARFIEKSQVPALFRVHKGPKADRLEDLRAFLSHRGLHLGGGDLPGPENYARLAAELAERPDHAIIELAMLRSMQQAVYQPRNEGHFGLSLSEYAHFTSPIRRYPDLLLHRAIKFVLTRKPVDEYPMGESAMRALGESCSMTERRADEATRDVVNWLKSEYMQAHVGSEFDGVIASVTSFGLFVELEGIHVEGLVHITNLPRDYYVFDQAAGALVGQHSGREYHLGDRLRVSVAAVNLDERKIDFLPAGEPLAGTRVERGALSKGISPRPLSDGKKSRRKRKGESRDHKSKNKSEAHRPSRKPTGKSEQAPVAERGAQNKASSRGRSRDESNREVNTTADGARGNNRSQGRKRTAEAEAPRDASRATQGRDKPYGKKKFVSKKSRPGEGDNRDGDTPRRERKISAEKAPHGKKTTASKGASRSKKTSSSREEPRDRTTAASRDAPRGKRTSSSKEASRDRTTAASRDTPRSKKKTGGKTFSSKKAPHSKKTSGGKKFNEQKASQGKKSLGGKKTAATGKGPKGKGKFSSKKTSKGKSGSQRTSASGKSDS